MMMFVIGILCITGNIYYTDQILALNYSNPVQVLYVPSLISLFFGLIIALDWFRIRIWGMSDEIMTVFNTTPDTRELIYFSTLCLVVGTTCLSYGLDGGVLSYTVVSACTIAPLMAQETAQPRWTSTLVILGVIACLMNAFPGDRKITYLNVFGSIIVGLGMGLYTHVVARTPQRSGFGNTVTFLLFGAINFLICTPLVHFRELEKDLLKIDQVAAPTKSGPLILYFIVSGLLTFLAAFSILNAVQHPKIRLADLTLYIALIPTGVLVLLDAFANKQVMTTPTILFMLGAVVLTVFNALIVRY